jgi:hypothetical protein
VLIDIAIQDNLPKKGNIFTVRTRRFRFHLRHSKHRAKNCGHGGATQESSAA